MQKLVGVACLILIGLVGCAPAASLSQESEPQINPGGRLDLAISEVTNNAGVEGDINALVQSVWSSSPSLRSWFTVVERMQNPEDTVLLVISVNDSSTSSDHANLPVLGTVWVYTTQVTVNVSLIDPVSSVVLASATGVGAESTTEYGGGEVLALRKAIQSGLYQAVKAYGGG